MNDYGSFGFFRFGCSDLVSRDEYSFIASLEQTDDTFVVVSSLATSEVVQGFYTICKLKILSKIHRFVGLEGCILAKYNGVRNFLL